MAFILHTCIQYYIEQQLRSKFLIKCSNYLYSIVLNAALASATSCVTLNITSRISGMNVFSQTRSDNSEDSIDGYDQFELLSSSTKDKCHYLAPFSFLICFLKLVNCVNVTK